MLRAVATVPSNRPNARDPDSRVPAEFARPKNSEDSGAMPDLAPSEHDPLWYDQAEPDDRPPLWLRAAANIFVIAQNTWRFVRGLRP